MKARFSKEERQELHRQLRESIEGAIQVDSHFSEVLPTVIALKLFKELSRNADLKPVLSRDPETLQPILTVTKANKPAEPPPSKSRSKKKT